MRSHNESSPHFSKPLTICNTETLESTIIQIRHNHDRIVLRKALGMPSYSPYLAWYFGIPSIPEDYENLDAESSLERHFHTEPEDMDWRNNAWFRAVEICAASELLSAEKEEKVCGMIREFEAKEERDFQTLDKQIELSLHNKPDIARAMMEGALMKWIRGSEKLMKSLKSELGIVTGESLNAITKGGNFRVRLHGVNLGELDSGKCLCGTSYSEYGLWSKCAGISESEGVIEFLPGEWLKDSVSCFTDLYMLLVDKSGRKQAGCVKVQVRG